MGENENIIVLELKMQLYWNYNALYCNLKVDTCGTLDLTKAKGMSLLFQIDLIVSIVFDYVFSMEVFIRNILIFKVSRISKFQNMIHVYVLCECMKILHTYYEIN